MSCMSNRLEDGARACCDDITFNVVSEGIDKIA